MMQVACDPIGVGEVTVITVPMDYDWAPDWKHHKVEVYG